MSVFDDIDLASLAPPDVVQALDYEQTLAAILADFAQRWPEFDAWVESDPAIKLLEVAAWREMRLRGEINDAARAVMLASATGADLDHLGAVFAVERDVATPADPDAVPPIEAVMEDDERYRRRIQLSPEARTSAGTRGAYTFHALSASPDVGDVTVTAHEPVPGSVTVTILSGVGAFEPSAELLNTVDARVSADDIRPICDTVVVEPATVIDFSIAATLTYLPGVAGAMARAAARAGVEALIARRRLGRDVTRSEIFAALHVAGVHNVVLASPAADVVVGPRQAARCASLTLTDGGDGE